MSNYYSKQLVTAQNQLTKFQGKLIEMREKMTKSSQILTV